MQSNNWSRSDKIAVASFVVAIIGTIAAVFVVPEFRHFVGLDNLQTFSSDQSPSQFKQIEQERYAKEAAERKARNEQAEVERARAAHEAAERKAEEERAAREAIKHKTPETQEREIVEGPAQKATLKSEMNVSPSEYKRPQDSTSLAALDEELTKLTSEFLRRHGPTTPSSQEKSSLDEFNRARAESSLAEFYRARAERAKALAGDTSPPSQEKSSLAEFYRKRAERAKTSKTLDKENRQRYAQLKKYETDVTTIQIFFNDGWNVRDPVYKMLGIIAKYKESTSVTYVLGYYRNLPEASLDDTAKQIKTRFDAVSESASTLSIPPVGGDSEPIEICRFTFNNGVLRSTNWSSTSLY